MVEIFSDEEIIKAVEPEIVAYIHEIADDIEAKSLEAIARFYADYSPYVYVRTGELQDIVQKPIIMGDTKQYSIIFHYTLAGGEGGNKMNGPFIQGFHGPPWGYGGRGGAAPKMSPSPWEVISDYATGKYNAWTA